MKKFLSFLLAFAFLPLCGCSAKEVVTSDKQEYIVSSLGFDSVGGNTKMMIEAIVVNTDDLSEEKQSRLIFGTGETVGEAYSEIVSKITQPLSLGHNAVTVIGGGIVLSQLKDIFAFCRKNTEINVATMLVYTDNAEKLLSCRAVSSVAVGFDIMSMIEVTEEQKGTLFNNRFYEAEALNTNPIKTFWMPRLTVKDDAFFVDGLAVFKNYEMIKALKNGELSAFCLVRDSLTRGVDNGMIINYSKVSYDFSYNKSLEITINAHIKGENIGTLKTKTEKILENEDIFGIGNIIAQKEPKIWEKIEENYDDYYKKAEIKVNIYE
ncbi:MAG: hypothetical protein IJO62_01155 [Clostridia bacterium]|nr:hypothetical protein [Clostridia bacterium]